MILTLKELAEHLKVNERTILRMRDNGQIEGVKIGGSSALPSCLLVASARALTSLVVATSW